MTTLTKQEANAKISEHLAAAYASINAAEALAIEHDLTFNFEIAYGMGGYFKGADADQEGGGYGESQNGWYPSSQSC